MLYHLSVFKEIVADLESMEVKYDDGDLGYILLCSMPSSFSNLGASRGVKGPEGSQRPKGSGRATVPPGPGAPAGWTKPRAVHHVPEASPRDRKGPCSPYQHKVL